MYKRQVIDWIGDLIGIRNRKTIQDFFNRSLKSQNAVLSGLFAFSAFHCCSFDVAAKNDKRRKRSGLVYCSWFLLESQDLPRVWGITVRYVLCRWIYCSVYRELCKNKPRPVRYDKATRHCRPYGRVYVCFKHHICSSFFAWFLFFALHFFFVIGQRLIVILDWVVW